MDLLKVLFIFTLLIAFPLGEISRINFVSSIGIILLDAGVFLTVLVWIIKYVAKKQKVERKLLIPISIFSLVALFSLLINFGSLKFSEFLISFLYLIRWIFYALVTFVIMSFDDRFKKRIKNLMLLSGIIIIFLGIVQYLFYSDLRNLRYAGWDEHLFRLFSSFLDPNFAGIFFVLYFLFALNYFFENRNKFILGIVFLSSMSIFLTFSRAAIISLIVSFFVLILMRNKAKIFWIFLLGFAFSVILLLNFPLKSEGTNLLRFASGEARIDSINRALIIIKDHPVFGIGFDAYRYAQKRYGFIDKNWEFIHSGAGTDNSFLFVFATTGIIGLFAYFYMWKNVIKFSNSPIFISSIIAVFVNSIFINSLFYTFVMFWMWVLVGLKRNN